MIARTKLISVLTWFCVAILLCGASISGAAQPFSFELKSPASTSAGVYSADGRLVRSLWSMEKLEAGSYTRSWDGTDDLGAQVPPGNYSFKVIANRATYRNVGAIGNSGPNDTLHHTPANMLGVATDEMGSVYTANGWDEAGADFKKWDADGASVYDANYSIRNGRPNGAPYAVATDGEYLYCAVGGWANTTWNEAQQIQRFHLKDGKSEKFTGTGRADGHIQIYEWPSRQIPSDATADEAALYKAPLRAIAIHGDLIFVADFLGNRVLKFNKTTGQAAGEFAVKKPQAIAFDAAGLLWIAHEQHRVDLYDVDGKLLAEPINGLGAIEALTISPSGTLVIADSDAAQVRFFQIDHLRATPTRSFGERAKTGDRDPSHFFHLRGVAIDANGNFFTIQVEPISGARLAKWKPDGSLAWEQFGCEFVSLGNYGINDPTKFYSLSLHEYELVDFNNGSWKYVADAFSAVGSDRDVKTSYIADPHGVPRVLRLGNHDFFYAPRGDGMQIYRVDGHALKLAALVGGRSPASTGEKEARESSRWSWSDDDGSNNPTPDKITWMKKPGEAGARYDVFGMDVDHAGNILYADQATHSVWELPLGPLTASGSPTYDWTKLHEVLKRNPQPFNFHPNMVQRADDGSYYAFGWSGPWPSPKNNPFWMGGTTLARFDPSGRLLWAARLPKICVGLDTIPGGGGCFVGQGDGAKLYHYNADGLAVGLCEPGEAMAKNSGWLDNHASVAVNRNPTDHLIDVFAEDDLVLRIGWYRVDDSQIETIGGKF